VGGVEETRMVSETPPLYERYPPKRGVSNPCQEKKPLWFYPTSISDTGRNSTLKYHKYFGCLEK
jgi:hypothetical protein